MRAVKYSVRKYGFVSFTLCYQVLIFFLKTRFKPSRNIITHTAEPVAMFIILMSFADIPAKETSIDLCNEKIATKASANEIFRNTFTLSGVFLLDLTKFIIAKVNFVNV